MEITNRVAFALLTAAAACGGGSSAPAVLMLSLSPDPIQEAACPPSDCGSLAGQDQAKATLTVSESGGVAVDVSAVAMSLKANATGAVLASGQFDAAALDQLAGGHRVPANGQRAIPVAVHYDAATGGDAATLTVTLTATDEHGHALSQVATAAVSP
jgi:hypothetical protein